MKQGTLTGIRRTNKMQRIIEAIKVPITAVSGLVGIELVKFAELSEIAQFLGQTVIGVLTIIYLIVKIKKISKR
jgi:hypothetical protein